MNLTRHDYLTGKSRYYVDGKQVIREAYYSECHNRALSCLHTVEAKDGHRIHYSVASDFRESV